MIKIEKLAAGTKATINGDSVVEGSFITQKALKRLVVTEGEVTIVINDSETKYINPKGYSAKPTIFSEEQSSNG